MLRVITEVKVLIAIMQKSPEHVFIINIWRECESAVLKISVFNGIQVACFSKKTCMV